MYKKSRFLILTQVHTLAIFTRLIKTMKQLFTLPNVKVVYVLDLRLMKILVFSLP